MDPSQVYQLVQQNWPEIVAGGVAVRALARWGWRYVADQYRHDPPAVIEKAAHNASDFTTRVSDKVRASLEAGSITEQQVLAALNEPSFGRLLQQCVLDASETASEFNHEQLARLVAQRLHAPTESARSIALRRSAEMLRNLTDRQLKLLGLVFTVTQSNPEFQATGDGEADLARYSALCELELMPFVGVELNNLDVEQMESLGLVSVASFAGKLAMRFGSQETRSPMFQRFGYEFQGTLLTAPPDQVYRRLSSLMSSDAATGGIGIEGIRLLLSGWLLGYSVYSQLRGEPLDLSAWD